MPIWEVIIHGRAASREPHNPWRGCTHRRGFLTCQTHTHCSFWHPCTRVFLLPIAPKYTDWPHIPGRGRNSAPEPVAEQLTEHKEMREQAEGIQLGFTIPELPVDANET